ncbi:hypothetical protein ZHAS_00005210 [Anopheles sinensis]|uniref:Uncharacterized protein n=1 Tax=Anopheles sinensis TaxID=74873 RepID=A0A084VIU6_ANOSI|nr:hypothetical protein ZHAS_00005210 [Anopheles sinensis]
MIGNQFSTGKNRQQSVVEDETNYQRGLPRMGPFPSSPPQTPVETPLSHLASSLIRKLPNARKYSVRKSQWIARKESIRRRTSTYVYHPGEM